MWRLLYLSFAAAAAAFEVPPSFVLDLRKAPEERSLLLACS